MEGPKESRRQWSDAESLPPDGPVLERRVAPACCTVEGVGPGAGTFRLAERLYAAYNAGGDPATAGLNFRGEPCPTWDALPENIRAKWEAAAALVENEMELYAERAVDAWRASR